jgi:hypothetical protein
MGGSWLNRDLSYPIYLVHIDIKRECSGDGYNTGLVIGAVLAHCHASSLCRDVSVDPTMRKRARVKI